MKKILIFIVGILGIGLSFCSADGIYHNSTLGLISVVYNGSTVYTLQDKNLGATCTTVDNDCSYGNYYQWGNNYGFSSAYYVQYNYVNNGSLDLSTYGPGNYFNSNGTFYGPNIYSSNNLDLWGSVTDTLEARRGPCDEGFHILKSWEPFISTISSLGVSTSNGDGVGQYLYMPYAGFRDQGDSRTSSQGSIGFYWSSTAIQNGRARDLYYMSSNLTAVDGSGWPQGYSVRCFKNSPVDPDSTWSVLFGDSINDPTPQNPKFKVNYGNTYYEYEIVNSENIEIYLESPTEQNGNVFSYIGATGLNLFYNGGIQRYNKDKLYLLTPSWYSNNIFTPICL